MANVRIIYDNAAERAAITANSTASGSVAANTLASNTKSVAHRSAQPSVTYTLIWTTPEQVSGFILPATNLSGSAQLAASIITSTDQTINLGTISACPNTPLNSYPGTRNVNSFPYGGVSKVAYWFSQVYTIKQLSIIIVDPDRVSLGYPSTIDCSQIVCGKYWEPTYNVSKSGLELTINDTTQVSRSDTGDLLADRGTIHELLNFNLEVLSKADKEQLVNIMRYVGTYRNIAVSIVPDANSRDEQDYIIYGKRENSSLGYIVHNFYQNSFSISGW